MLAILGGGAAPRTAPAPLNPTVTQLVYTVQPGGAVDGVDFTQQPVLEARDISNVIVTGYNASVTITKLSGPATLSGTTQINFVNGVATFTNLRLTSGTGTHTLRATSSTFTKDSNSFSNTASGGATPITDNPYDSLSAPTGWSEFDPANRMSIATDGTSAGPGTNVCQCQITNGDADGNFGISTYAPAGGMPTEEWIEFQMFVENTFDNGGSSSDVFKVWWEFLNSGGDVLLAIRNSVAPYKFGFEPEIAAYGSDTFYRFANVQDDGVPLGSWFTLRLYRKYSSAAGVADGKFKWWLNGVLQASHADIKFPATSTKFVEMRIEPYQGGFGGHARATAKIKYNNAKVYDTDPGW